MRYKNTMEMINYYTLQAIKSDIKSWRRLYCLMMANHYFTAYDNNWIDDYLVI